MNDLEPWKIWAVTGVLVAAILGCTAMRVRPQVGFEAVAEASTLTPEQSSPAVTSELTRSLDQDDGYYSGMAPVSYSRANYSPMQSTTFAPTNNQPSSLTSISSPADENDHDPELDVTQQVLRTDNYQTDVASSFTSEQPTDEMASWFLSDVPVTNQDELDVIGTRSSERWVEASDGYAEPLNDNTYSADVNGAVLLNQTKLDVLGVVNNVLTNTAIQVALSGEDVEAPNENGTLVLRVLNDAGSQARLYGLSLASGASPDEFDSESIVKLARMQVLTQAAADADVLARAVAAQEEEALAQQQFTAVRPQSNQYIDTQYW